MLEWKVKTGDEQLRESIETCKATFDTWFKDYWSKTCTKEKMLSEKSPLPHVYYKMTKSFEEVKKLLPLEAKHECKNCRKMVDKWIYTSFSFCDEYSCGITLCEKCAKKWAKKFKELFAK